MDFFFLDFFYRSARRRWRYPIRLKKPFFGKSGGQRYWTSGIGWGVTLSGGGGVPKQHSRRERDYEKVWQRGETCDTSRYSVYLLYWHKSTNTDAALLHGMILEELRQLEIIIWIMISCQSLSTAIRLTEAFFFCRTIARWLGNDPQPDWAGAHLLYWYKGTCLLVQKYKYWHLRSCCSISL